MSTLSTLERRRSETGTLDACSTPRATTVLFLTGICRLLASSVSAGTHWNKRIGLLLFQLLTYGYHGLFRGIFLSSIRTFRDLIAD
jgi:hypothetical protein